ncbi:hypothetical protein [Haloferax sp. YSSS75]|uniref:hypothetical protein n=1 Tax=Haloferax sp. YSSS75 TaxID=3388564 RepID=UPI00398D4CFF
MGNERYEEGETVPTEVCSVPDRWVFVRFAVDVELSHGYGGAKHIYPTEQIEEPADLFTNGESTIQSVLCEDVHLYTTPRHRLR